MIIATHGIVASQLAGFDADAQAFFDRVTTAGGSLSNTEKTAVNQLVLDMKSYSIWSNMKAIYPMVGASSAACAQNLKSSSFTGTFTSGWTFASTGITPNGTTSCFFNTNLNTNTLSQNNTAIGFYSRTNIIATQTDMGIAQTISLNMGANFQGAGAFSRNFTSAFGGFTNTNTQGFYINSRINSTEHKMYKNATVLGTITSNSSSLSADSNISIGGEMVATNLSVNWPSSKEFAFGFISNGLSDTEASNFYTAVQAFQTTLSRNV